MMQVIMRSSQYEEFVGVFGHDHDQSWNEGDNIGINEVVLDQANPWIIAAFLCC